MQIPMPLAMLFAVFFVFACSGEEAGSAPAATEISREAFGSRPVGSFLILDVRTPEEFAAGHLKNALNIPHDRLDERMSDFRKYANVPVLVYCKSGRRAERAIEVLSEAGFTNLNHLTGDMDGWLEAGYPVTKEVL